jgi:serine/threonine protein kinase
MRTLQKLSTLALQPLLRGAGEAVGLKVVGQGSAALVGFLVQRFSDHSHRLEEALRAASDRAWRTLELALAGPSWWQRCQVLLSSAEQQSFRRQMQAFLDATPLDELENHGAEFREECLRQLRAARKAGLLTTGSLSPEQLAKGTADFARFADPASLLDAELRTLEQVGEELRQAGYPDVAHFVTLRPGDGPPLLVSAVRYFFRREVETGEQLFRSLAFARLEGLSQAQEEGFAALHEALAQHGERLEGLLEEVHAVVAETHQNALDVKAELSRQNQRLQELGQAVMQALAQRQLERRELRADDSLSVRGEPERQVVRALVERYRALPAEQRRRLPALLNALGKLEVVAGDFDAAQRDFQEVAGLVAEPSARAEAQFNAYRACLERRDWTEALMALRQAASLDPERFAPFPLSKFEPERILGAGGFGVAFLCRNRHSEGRVVIKTLSPDGLDRAVTEVFREAQVLEALDHPSIIRVLDCDYADAAERRPYLVMDYFEGKTLAEYVEAHGPLPADEAIGLARTAAEGLQAAHAKGILHRDVKPANLLVRRAGEGWQVRLIDFGLALRQPSLQSTARGAAALDRTVVGSSIAGTLDYAAPEQLGRLRAPVGPTADVYGFGKTCCYALFKTPQPTWQHWQKLPPKLADLLGRCLAENPSERPSNFTSVVNSLTRLRGGKETAVVDALPVAEEPRPVAPAFQPPSPARPRPRREPPPPASKPARAPKSRRRLWPLLVGGGVVLFVVLAVTSAVVFWRGGTGGLRSAVGLPAESRFVITSANLYRIGLLQKINVAYRFEGTPFPPGTICFWVVRSERGTLFERGFNPPPGPSTGTFSTTAPGAATWKTQGQVEIFIEVVRPGVGQRERASNAVPLR